MATNHKPHVVVLGGNFAGLGIAQKIREYAGDRVSITVIDKKSNLLFVPSIPAEVFANHDPALSMFMDIIKPLNDDGIRFIQGEVTGIDPVRQMVDYIPSERPGSESHKINFDYLVIALGSRLAYDRIEGFAEYGHTLSDTYHGNQLRHYLHEEYKGGRIAIGSARFHQGDGANGLEPYPDGKIPIAEAACEGPPVETMLSAAIWLQEHSKGEAKEHYCIHSGGAHCRGCWCDCRQRVTGHRRQHGVRLHEQDRGYRLPHQGWNRIYQWTVSGGRSEDHIPGLGFP